MELRPPFYLNYPPVWWAIHEEEITDLLSPTLSKPLGGITPYRQSALVTF